MANKRFEMTVNGATAVIVTTTARLALQTAGVILPDGERASSGKTYYSTEATGSLPVTYRVLTDEQAQAHLNGKTAAVEPLAAMVGYPSLAPEPKAATSVFTSQAANWPPVPPPSRRNRSRALFGVVRAARA
jgi:hypothetical protein